ncbi:MAG: hypothetical protein HQ501_04505 [Rhodospirillales bacterium]|nr:hypothetical protein [Rhodospirillales bacterium]
MSGFTIDGFAQGSKKAMADADDRQRALKEYLEQTMQEHDTADIIAALNAAIPEGATIGEMIVHASPELTMLYGRIPPRLQSGIHNHTVFACIGQLDGEETSIVYEKSPDGTGLREVMTVTAKAGEVTSLPVDAIHRIENPGTEMASALHCYGGDFGAVMGQRSLWSCDDFEEMPFSFEALLKESVKIMKNSDNDVGLKAIVKAIPAAGPLVDAL